MESFGYKVQVARKKKGWSVRTFVEKMGLELSPSYITKIEIHEEIPSPELICEMAKVLELDAEELLRSAIESKTSKFARSLNKRYQRAVSKSF